MMKSLRILVHLSRRMNTENSVQWQQSVRLMCSANVNSLAVKEPVKKSTILPNDDLEREMMAIYEEEENHRTRSILAPPEDESQVYAEPAILPTYNLAAYVQKSETLQKMISIGVNLHRLEHKNCSEFVANLDFERDIQPYIMLLCKDIGLDSADLGTFLTKNIFILKENIDDIRTRVNYLQSKNFTPENIVQIIKWNPKWLNYSTKTIDKRLGHFQNMFKLTGNEVRLLVLQRSGLITSDLEVVKHATFTIREEFGFKNVNDLKKIILKCPVLFELDRLTLMDRYDYISRVMKIDNDQIVMDPTILKYRTFQTKERHGFLKKIGRAQYNPKLPLYISLTAMCTGNDLEFCENVAKRSYEEYDGYLRTL